MERYVDRYNGDIITNFDQQRPAFRNVPFSLDKVMTGSFDRGLLEPYFNNAQVIIQAVERINIEKMETQKLKMKTEKVDVTVRNGATFVEGNKIRNPWISGSFYLATAVVIITLLLVVSRTVHFSVLPVVVVASLLIVSLIGAYQLRQDASLSEENFLSLIKLVFQQVPFLRKHGRNDKGKPESNGSTPAE
jgi:hypothetical protein